MSEVTSLFPADTGALPLEARRVLTNLLIGPTIEGARHSRLWATLLRDERLIRSRLHELFLDLVIDYDLQVAFVRQADTAEMDVPALLRKTSLNFKETVLVLHLRQQLAGADAKGERCVVERDAMVAHLDMYTPANTNDTVKVAKQSEAAIEKMVKLGILNKLKGNETTYEVSPVLKLTFTTEDIKAMATMYENLRNQDEPVIEADDAAVGEVVASAEPAQAVVPEGIPPSLQGLPVAAELATGPKSVMTIATTLLGSATPAITEEI